MPTRLLLVLLLLVTLFWLVLWPSPAGAGTYDVYSCRLPDGTPVPAKGWASFATDLTTFELTSSCASEGLVARAAAGGISGSGAGWVFTAPSDLSITSFEVDRYFRAGKQAPNDPEFEYATSVRGWPPSDPIAAEERCGQGSPVSSTAPNSVRRRIACTAETASK